MLHLTESEAGHSMRRYSIKRAEPQFGRHTVYFARDCHRFSTLLTSF